MSVPRTESSQPCASIPSSAFDQGWPHVLRGGKVACYSNKRYSGNVRDDPVCTDILFRSSRSLGQRASRIPPEMVIPSTTTIRRCLSFLMNVHESFFTVPRSATEMGSFLLSQCCCWRNVWWTLCNLIPVHSKPFQEHSSLFQQHLHQVCHTCYGLTANCFVVLICDFRLFLHQVGDLPPCEIPPSAYAFKAQPFISMRGGTALKLPLKSQSVPLFDRP